MCGTCDTHNMSEGAACEECGNSPCTCETAKNAGGDACCGNGECQC